MESKKAQSTLKEGPALVLTIAFMFILMATVAFVGSQYQGAFSRDSSTVVNETISSITEVAANAGTNQQCNFESFSVEHCINSTFNPVFNLTIGTGNYTVDAVKGTIAFTGADTGYNNTDWNCTYSYRASGNECNVTTDMQAEILSNTSMVGMILTIGIVGIILGVLLSVFFGRKRGI